MASNGSMLRGEPAPFHLKTMRHVPSLLARLPTSRDVQKSRAARTPEELSTRSAEDLAADLFDVYLKLSHRLAGIQNVEHVEPPTQLPHFDGGARLGLQEACR